MKEKVTRIGVSFPPQLLEKFDSLIEEMGYENRSEAIRDAIRDYMVKNQIKDDSGEGVGLISLVYDHDTRGVSDTLIDLQHDYFKIIQSSTHIHLDKHSCMELITVKGEIKKIREIKNKLASLRGVKHAHLWVTTII